MLSSSGFLMTVLATLTLQAQQDAPLRARATRPVDAMLACRETPDPQARLTCFDREAERLAAARERGEITVLDRERVRAANRSLFGFTAPALDLFAEEEGREKRAEPLREIESVVKQVAGGSAGLAVLRLEDGSVWRLTESARIAPRVGDTIRIVRGPLGSYRAAIDGRRLVRIVRDR
ncbi:hypothetical protein ACBY01_09680 [Sphingomonas sp. ac-8]|uniref:hypothetical protein n=1 Tax=Sphingomonas sp. ac-8 TaxID=3242977 RepID=UPI003A80409A